MDYYVHTVNFSCSEKLPDALSNKELYHVQHAFHAATFFMWERFRCHQYCFILFHGSEKKGILSPSPRLHVLLLLLPLWKMDRIGWLTFKREFFDIRPFFFHHFLRISCLVQSMFNLDKSNLLDFSTIAPSQFLINIKTPLRSDFGLGNFFSLHKSNVDCNTTVPMYVYVLQRCLFQWGFFLLPLLFFFLHFLCSSVFFSIFHLLHCVHANRTT